MIRPASYVQFYFKKVRIVWGMPLLFLIGIGYSCRKVINERQQTYTPEVTMTGTVAVGDEFSIAVIGDTQNYVDLGNESVDCQERSHFQDMIDWIVANKTTENIKYVVSLGDITDEYYNTDPSSPSYYDKADSVPRFQWKRAYNIYNGLKTANIPFGVVPGNHDIAFAARDNYPNNGTTFPANPFFHFYFGRPQFPSYNKAGFPNPSSNQNHYDVISTPAGEFMILYLRWHHIQQEADDAIDWAYTMMSKPENASRKVIIVTHYAVANTDVDPVDGKRDWGMQRYHQGYYFSQANKIYTKFKSFPNFFMFLGGHHTGEYDRQDTYNGKTVKSFTTDFSNSCGTGSSSYPPGVLRIMKFSASKDLIEIRNFVPGQTPFRTYTKPWYHGFTTVRTNDYDNNGKSELAFFNNGVFKNQSSTVNFPTTADPGDIPVPADYNGEGKTIPAVYRPSVNQWIAQGKGYVTFPAAVLNGIPAPGDYDGNGTVDYALYEPSTGKWHERQTYLANDYKVTTYGSSTDIPIPADYDGDGKTNYSLFRPATSSAKAEFIMYSFRRNVFVGQPGDVLIPVPGDYNGDGRVDCAVYNTTNNSFTWIKMLTETDTPVLTTVNFGSANAIPAPGDYNGDGKTDFAYYLNGTLYVKDGVNVTFGGTSGDKLLNLPYHIRKFFFP